MHARTHARTHALLALRSDFRSNGSDSDMIAVRAERGEYDRLQFNGR